MDPIDKAEIQGSYKDPTYIYCTYDTTKTNHTYESIPYRTVLEEKSR